MDDADLSLDQLYLCQLDYVAKMGWHLENDEFMTNLHQCFNDFLRSISTASYYLLFPNQVGVSQLLTMILWDKIKTRGILYSNRKIYGSQNVLILTDRVSSVTCTMIEEFLRRNGHNTDIKIHIVAPYVNDSLPESWQLYTVVNATTPDLNSKALIDRLSRAIGPVIDY